MADVVVGIDVGTTVVKSAAFTLDDPSIPIAVNRCPSATCAPLPGWSEADPTTVEARALQTLAAVTAKVGPERIAAVGISGTACGAWLVNAVGQPIRPAILWNDGRASAIVERWKADGALDRIFEISGNVPYPGYTLPVLAWLAEHEPEHLAQAASLLWAKDWLRFRLTGEMGADESDASYVPFDIRRRAWSDELLDLAGVRSYRPLFPELLDPRYVAPLSLEAGEITGLRAGTPVAVGATDIIAGVAGAGAVAPGRAVTLFGTSANSTVITEEPVFQPTGVGIMAAAPLGRYARTMVNTSGSTTLDWAAALLTGGDVGRLGELATEAPEGCDGALLVPYLSPAGVVSPFVDAHATGTIAGLRSYHGPAHLARAAFEGLAMAVADGYVSMPVNVDRIIAVGGAARSDLLLQALADVSGTVVDRLKGEEFGARGVALLSAWAAGLIEDLAGVAASVEVDRSFEPAADGPLAGALARYQAVAAASRGVDR